MDALTWKAELIDEVRTLSNLKELETLWLGKDPHRISSFTEEVAHVFADLDIDSFLALDPTVVGLSEIQRQSLIQFRDALSDYVDATKHVHRDDKAILEDPSFRRITGLADLFIQQLEIGS